MNTISLRLEENDYKLVQEYITTNNLTLSNFVRDAIMDKLEEDLEIDENKILNAYKQSFEEKSIDNTEVWERLGV